MKKLIVLPILLIVMNVFAQDKPAYIIYNSKGKAVKYGKMIKDLNEGDMLFFGELHDNPVVHWLQLEVTKSMHDLKGDKLVLGAEMFEADNQLLIDEYLGDMISESSFEKEARLWPNHKTDYKPLLLFAKEHKLPFVASNVPRRYASMVFKKGDAALNDLPDGAKDFIAPLPITFDLEVPCYKNMLTMMSGHGGTANENFPKSQAVKDATMAHFILKNWSSGQYFVHYQGAYHSDNKEGIIWYIRQQNKDATIKSISAVYQEDISKLEEKNQGIADYIICVPENMTRTY